MVKPGFRESIIAYIRENARPPDKFSHQSRLHQLARELAEEQPFDDDVLFAAAWMHDLGVFVGHRPEEPAALAAWDNVAYAVRQAPEILTRLGFPEEKIPAVLDVIKTHLPSTQPTSFEGVLLRDADILEQLGAIGILRTVSKIGRDTRFVQFADSLQTLHRNLDQLPQQLALDSARRRVEARRKILREFLDSAESEAAGNGL